MSQQKVKVSFVFFNNVIFLFTEDTSAKEVSRVGLNLIQYPDIVVTRYMNLHLSFTHSKYFITFLLKLKLVTH